MKWVSYQAGGKEWYGVWNDDASAVWNLAKIAEESGAAALPPSLIEAIRNGHAVETANRLIEYASGHHPSRYLDKEEDIRLLAPIPRPRKNIMCVGKNYRDHAIEMGSEKDIPAELMVFTKSPTSVAAPEQTIEAHEAITSELDYEGELAIIIGKGGRDIRENEAFSHVFGYTIINDVTARDLQTRHQQFFIGKSLDTSCPMGPWIVHHSAIKDPGSLDITTKVNGEIRQQSNTSLFIFPIQTIISVLSRGMTLEPGDIIATGTPAGVGKGFHPPRFLKKGDKIEISIESIGVLANSVN